MHFNKNEYIGTEGLQDDSQTKPCMYLIPCIDKLHDQE